MKKSFDVFSMSTHTTDVKATLPGGVEVDAHVPSLEVQLVAKDGKTGTLKLVFVEPAEIEEANEKFVVGESVDIEF